MNLRSEIEEVVAYASLKDCCREFTADVDAILAAVREALLGEDAIEAACEAIPAFNVDTDDVRAGVLAALEVAGV